MARKDGYQTIPDVEEGGGDAKLSLKETYPEANETELQLLGLLDESTAASPAAVNVSLPQVSADDVATQSPNFFFALISPTFVALLCFAAALFVKDAPFDFSVKIFPYVVAIFIFGASVPSIDGRIMKQMAFVFETMTRAEEGVFGSMDGVTQMVDDKVSAVQSKLGDVVGPWKSRLDKATKVEKRLKQLNPKFDIPDLTDVEKELDGAVDEVANQMDTAKKSMDIASLIPGKLASPSTFYNRVVLPVLAVCCLFQVLTAFLIVFFLGVNEVEIITLGAQRQLWWFFFDDDDDDVETSSVYEAADVFNMGELNEEEMNVYQEAIESRNLDNDTIVLIEESLPLIYVVGACFGLAVIQIAVVYILTRPSAIAGMINAANQEVANSASRTLREQGVGNLCSDILGTRMDRIKTKIWSMIQAMIQLETIMTKLSTLATAAKVGTSGSQTAKRLAASAKLENSKKGGIGSFFGLGN